MMTETIPNAVEALDELMKAQRRWQQAESDLRKSLRRLRVALTLFWIALAFNAFAVVFRLVHR